MSDVPFSSEKLIREVLPVAAGRARVYLDAEKFEEAVKDCSAMIRLDPKDVRGYYWRHDAYGALGKEREAARDLATARRLDAEFVEVWEAVLAEDSDEPEDE